MTTTISTQDPLREERDAGPRRTTPGSGKAWALVGAGFTTEIVFGLESDDLALDPEFAAVVGHWLGTIPWLWVGAGVTGVAVAVAALRHAAAPRWIGWTAAVLGGITLLAGVSPMQYLAGFTGPVLVLLLGLGFALGDRRARTGR